ncbi:hypothetical protein LGN20_34795 [Burkholderia cepacia]|uniref:hypothetical protein n=1 Tax=Burkholderia cepacia TaxID=292 RepID=UPI001CF14590|nr:hypothetical protein [Burkholderia cepacia]MCA8219094.1 hypothetical protein [Burkholderia cepacia]
MNDHVQGQGSNPKYGCENGEAMAVAVITPSGAFPNEDDYRRAYRAQPVGELLEAAKEHLKLTNVSDWVAFVENRPIDTARTFAENGLCGIVEIEWHKHEGGGGA